MKVTTWTLRLEGNELIFNHKIIQNVRELLSSGGIKLKNSSRSGL